MSNVQAKAELAALGTRETVIEIDATIAVTDTADNNTQEAVTFDKAFASAPRVIGVNAPLAASIKGTVSVTDITTTGCNINIYQHDLGDLATQDHTVKALVVGKLAV